MAEFNKSDRTWTTTRAEEPFLSTRVRFRFSVVIFFLFCSFTCICLQINSSVVECPLRYPHKNYLRFVFTLIWYVSISDGFNVFLFACVWVIFFSSWRNARYCHLREGFLDGGKTVFYYLKIMSESDMQNIFWGSRRKTSYPTGSV